MVTLCFFPTHACIYEVREMWSQFSSFYQLVYGPFLCQHGWMVCRWGRQKIRRKKLEIQNKEERGRRRQWWCVAKKGEEEEEDVCHLRVCGKEETSAIANPRKTTKLILPHHQPFYIILMLVTMFNFILSITYIFRLSDPLFSDI